MTQSTIVRVAVLAILLVNQVLVAFGFEPLPFDEQQIYEAVSTVATVVMAIITTYFNNDVTPEGRAGTEKTRQLKEENKSSKGGGGKPQ